MKKGNKGEWSEFYVLLKLIGDGKLFLADKNLNRNNKYYYVVLKVFRDEKQGRTTYDITKQSNAILVLDNEHRMVGRVKRAEVIKAIPSVFREIKNNTDKTFSTSHLDSLLRKLHCQQIQAGSGKKIDISAQVNDTNAIVQPPELGFSIKSMLSAPATLLNASGSTNFTYLIDGLSDKQISSINAIQTKSKVKNRLKEVLAQGGKIIFEKTENPTFDKNLKKIDSQFTEVLASILLDFFLSKGSRLTDLTRINQQKFPKIEVRYIVKKFLGAIALGMFPSKDWDGINNVNGGYILVKDNGEIICFHLFNESIFRDYLILNVKLDTPSTSRHKFGSIIVENNQVKIRLNLQIRFIK